MADVRVEMCTQDLDILNGSTAIFGRGGAGVAVKALRYKPADRGFDSQWCHWIFFSDIILPIDSTCNRSEYQVYFQWVKAAGA
jgi:hypothetical protein